MTEPFHPDRLQRLVELRAAGVDPYPPRAGFEALGAERREPAAELAAAADARAGETVAVSGRILGRRGYGKLVFLDLWDRSGRIQVCLQKDRVPEADFGLTKLVNRGDFVAVRGELSRTQKGEPTVFGESFEILTKALLDPPEKWHGLNDPELRARLRYVDLFTDPEARARFVRRSAILRSMREVFAAHDYLEVETPVLHPIYGGAAARPFVTHHNALDMRLYLRIAPELYLKRLIVGGLERVCEFARVFRNEGISNRHNPEFTMLEFYAAFTDYRGMADLTEDLIAGAARAAGLEADGQLVARFRGREYDLSPPYPRERYADLFQKALGFAPGDSDAVTAALAARGMERPAGAARYAHWKAVNDLFEAAVEPELDGPVFVMDYPQAISPLAKPCPGDPEWTERFEFFLGGMELANAFSELNDPQLQLENFRRQLDTKDPEAPNEIDWDYVRALAYGMPPAGGCGIGIDRVAMVLLGVDTIREVLLFPLLRPESELPDFGDAAVAETPAGAQG